MSSDNILSDVEEDEESNTVSISKFRELLSELDQEKQARKTLQVSFNRLKVLTHEAIRKRDEAVNSRDEMKEQLEDALRVRESSRSEIETAARILVTGVDDISSKVIRYKDFGEGGLPRSEKYSRGLPGVAYGVIMRMEEIVKELVGLLEGANNGDGARGELEQRNYVVALQVSEILADIGRLREEGKEGERLYKEVEEIDEKIKGLKAGREDEVMKLRRCVGEYESRASGLEAKMEVQRSLVIDQLDFVGRIHQQLHDVMEIVDFGKASKLLFVARESDVEGNIRASLAGLESIYDLSRSIVEKTRDLVDENKGEVKLLNESVAQLVKEKEQVGLLLRTAMSRRMSVDLSSKTNELFNVAENGLREAGIDYKFSDSIDKNKNHDSKGVASTTHPEDNEVYALAGALENIIKQSQLEIVDLKHTVEQLREESCLLREQLATHSKELTQRKLRVEELEERERVANENVEGLLLDITAAEEEITRWKVAAQEEAAAGKAVEEVYTEQLADVRLELEEAKRAVIQFEKKLKFKEETAVAAMAAREAAEKSLRLADMRSTRLRAKVDELAHQLQERGSGETSRTFAKRQRYMCWPWKWQGLDFVGYHKQPESQLESANEMELFEPLL